MDKKQLFTQSEYDRILTSFEKQGSRLFKIIIFLLLSNLVFMYLYFTNPQNIGINLIQDKTSLSEQTVNR